MSLVRRRSSLVPIILVLVVITASGALANDNDTAQHRHSRFWGFRVHQALPAD